MTLEVKGSPKLLQFLWGTWVSILIVMNPNPFSSYQDVSLKTTNVNGVAREKASGSTK